MDGADEEGAGAGRGRECLGDGSLVFPEARVAVFVGVEREREEGLGGRAGGGGGGEEFTLGEDDDEDDAVRLKSGILTSSNGSTYLLDVQTLLLLRVYSRAVLNGHT